jgi:hypothetical protein
MRRPLYVRAILWGWLAAVVLALGWFAVRVVVAIIA